MPLTLEQAVARGWTVKGDSAWAPGADTNESATVQALTDGDPLPVLLCNIAELEGIGDVAGYGAPVTESPPAPDRLSGAIIAAVVAAVPTANRATVEDAVNAALDPAAPSAVQLPGGNP